MSTYYKKLGRRYIPVEMAELNSKFSSGLYLIYQNKNSSCIENLTVQKVHDCKNLGLYSDMIVHLKDKVIKKTINEFEGKRYSYTDLLERMFINIINELDK